MEAKIRIVEISPKLKVFKNNSNDIISISFISDNYSIKIEDIEKAILSNDKIIINLKELKDSKGKNNIQPIKYSLIRNNNNIISTGEFTPIEGVQWYKLNEIRNNISKESLITSSTSNGNIKNYNNNMSRRAHNLSDWNNSYTIEPMTNHYSKNNFYQLTNNSSLTIKIKLSINFLNKKHISTKNNTSTNINHYFTIKNNNYTKEPSENSSNNEILLDKEIFNEEDFTIIDSDSNKVKEKNKVLTTSKRLNKSNKFSSGKQTKRFSKKKLDFISNQNQLISGGSGGVGIKNPINAKTIAVVINNNKKALSRGKVNNSKNKKLLNEDKKMKTSMGFNKRRNENENNEMYDNLILEKNNLIDNNEVRKMNSSKNIEDEIFDQNFKNYIKNDEILKTNLSRNNSLQNLNQDNDLKETSYQNTCLVNPTINDNSQPAGRNKKKIHKDNKIKNDSNNNIQISKNIPEMNTNSLYEDIQLLKTHSDNEYIISESLANNLITKYDNNSFENTSLHNNDNENFERLKNDFFLLYSKENLNKINNDVLFLEIQLLIEKILALQKKHQEEYINLLNSININKNLFINNQSKYILLIKKLNKLKVKKLNNDIVSIKKDLYNGNIIHNFINKRTKIMNKGEFIIWSKIIENSNKPQIISNNKNKIINIFLND